MKFSATNIGRFGTVELELKGLTVIAGTNGCGKTTLGKALYAATKCETYLLANILQKKSEIIQETLSNLDFVVFLSDQNSSIKEKQSIDNEVLKRIKAVQENVSKKRTPSGSTYQNTIDEIVHLLKDPKVREALNSLGRLGVRSSYDETIAILQTPVNFDDSDFNKKLVQYVFHSEFEDQLSNFSNSAGTSSVRIETDTSKSSFLFGNNKCTSCLFGSPTFQNIIYLDDVYALDNRHHHPLQMGTPRTVSGRRLAIEVNERGAACSFDTDHRQDLVSLLSYIAQPTSRTIDEDISLDKIAEKFDPIFREIIGGQFHYSKESKDFMFSENEENLFLRNTASGAKAIGIIELLLRNGYIHDSTCLIIDEPETHLHPEWQIKLARLLVTLATETSIKILLNTHSPYFVEAIRTYSELNTIGEKTKFYFVEPQDQFSSSILDVSDNITQIFEILAAPYRTLDLAYQEKL
ncbi:MAG TPA: AAA family ATPase [Sphaerochaeta sp.]|nr:AAA family ATPase [Sphaerochaeta sp.]